MSLFRVFWSNLAIRWQEFRSRHQLRAEQMKAIGSRK